MKAAKDPKSIYRGPQWSPEHRWIGCLGSPSTSPYSEYKMGLLALNCANMDEPAVAPPGPLLPINRHEGARTGSSRHPRKVAGSPVS